MALREHLEEVRRSCRVFEEGAAARDASVQEACLAEVRHARECFKPLPQAVTEAMKAFDAWNVERLVVLGSVVRESQSPLEGARQFLRETVLRAEGPTSLAGINRIDR